MLDLQRPHSQCETLCVWDHCLQCFHAQAEWPCPRSNHIALGIIRDRTAKTSTSNGYVSGYCMFFYYVSRLGRMKPVLSHKLWFPWKDQYYYRLAYLQKSVIRTSVQSVKVFASKRMSSRKGLAWDKLSSKSLPNFLIIMLC